MPFSKASNRENIFVLRCLKCRCITLLLLSFVRFRSISFGFSYLYGNDGRQKDVVQCLGFHADIDLLDTETESSDQLFHGTQDKAKTRLCQALEFAPTFNDADLGRANGKTAGNAHGVVVELTSATSAVIDCWFGTWNS